MVAFRKLFPVLAIGAFLLGTATTASAQTGTVGGNPLVCDTNAGVPPIVRAEGYTELVGDIVIRCTGGNPTLGAQQANFQLFLNTNVTSRLLGDGLSEALLMIDEPGGPANSEFCVSPGFLSNPNPTTACNPAVANSPTQTGTYNVFRAQPARAANGVDNAAVVWAGIPIVAPGTNNFRTIRITNIRANATAVPASASLVPSQIFAFVSISASQSLALNNPQQAVAFVLPGMQFDVRNCANTGGGNQTFLQCVSRNSDLFTNPSAGGPFNQQIFGVRFREGFQTAFKTRISVNPDQSVSVPGVIYNTESGFVRSGSALGTAVGVANTATRVAARFNNLPEGIRLFVSTSNVAVTGSNASAILVSTDANGAGGTLSTGLGSTPVGVASTTTLTCGTSTPAAAELTISGTGTGRSAIAVWEITDASSLTLDTLFFAVGVAFTANTPNNLPGLGTSTVSGSFAPFYAAGTSQTSGPGAASSTLPIPRFIDTPITANEFTINQCVTNLLFPFVTNQAGFDTGIAISNTSRDPFSNNAGRVQNGTCTINYYGSTPGGPAPAADTTTNPVNAGEQLLFVLSSGGANGIDAVPGFQGYIIAQCRFQYAHGFAFVTDGPIGQARVAEGYLALVMDESVGTRTGSQSETLGH